MLTRNKITLILSLTALGALSIAACNALSGLTGAGLGAVDNGPASITDGRKNALRDIDTTGGKMLRFEVRQLAFPTPVGFSRCDPFGVAGNTAWPVLYGLTFTPGKATPLPDPIPSEYDWIADVGDTDICLGLRTPGGTSFPLQFTQLELSLRAVNPRAYGHVDAADSDFNFFVGPPPHTMADFPSNDNTAANRSLINLAGGDVALVIYGVDFAGIPGAGTTTGYMRTLGPTAWLVFMRDNGFQSGRFYNITGAMKGAPRAFADTSTPLDDGFFESVQVNGDRFDQFSEQLGPPTPPFGPAYTVCVGGVPSGNYAFLDMSNLDESLAAGGGQGGGALIIRREAFLGAQVVANPNTPGPLPADVGAADLFGPPFSGYNATVITALGAPQSNNPAAGPPGVHEIGWSIFFIHGS